MMTGPIVQNGGHFGHIHGSSSSGGSNNYENRLKISSEIQPMTSAEVHQIWDCFNQLRLRGDLCDVTLLVGDVVFQLHRTVLASNSEYFRALFISGMKETIENEVKLADTDPEVMNTIIEYMYTRKVHLTAENVWNLIAQAGRLMMNGLVERCSSFITDQLSLDNCVKFMTTARCYNFCDVDKASRDYILTHFTRVSLTSHDFLSLLELGDVIDLIVDDELNVTSEEITWDAIMRWIDYAYAARAKFAPYLLHKMRLGLLSPDYYLSKVSGYPAIARSEGSEVGVFIKNIWNEYFSAVETLGHSIVSLSNDQLRPRIPHDVLFVIGGWSGGSPVSYIETFDPRASRWYSHPMLEDVTPRAYHGLVAHGGMIYILGGFDGTQYYNSVKRFDPINKTWATVASMYTQRCYVSAAVLDGFIYACGGFDGRYRLSSVEKFESSRNQWKQIQPMFHRRSDAAAASLRGILYIAGGFNGDQCLASCESYDPVVDQWTLLQSMLSPRSGVSVLAFKGLLYALGGFDGDHRLATCERYCPISRSWEFIANMFAARSNFAVSALDDRIYVIGGFNGASTIPQVECYHANLNSWKRTTDMNVNRSALKACVVCNMSDAKYYTYYGHQGYGGDLETGMSSKSSVPVPPNHEDMLD